MTEDEYPEHFDLSKDTLNKELLNTPYPKSLRTLFEGVKRISPVYKVRDKVKESEENNLFEVDETVEKFGVYDD